MLEVRRTASADTRTVVEAHGQVDLATAGQLSKTLVEVIGDGVTEVVVDLAKVDFMDSTGVRALVQAARAADEADARLYVRGAQGWVARVLEITGVAGYLRLPDGWEPIPGDARR